MREVVLAQQVLAVIVTVGGTHHAVDMLLRGLLGILRKLRQVRRPLMIKFDENHRTLYAVVKDAVLLRPADPRKPGIVDVAIHFVHFDAGVAIIHVADVQIDKVP